MHIREKGFVAVLLCFCFLVGDKKKGRETRRWKGNGEGKDGLGDCHTGV